MNDERKDALRTPDLPPNAVEEIKRNSHYLRGTLVASLADPLTGALRPDDAQLCKFHGFYQQDDRDRRAERREQKLEPLYSFMLRVCVPGGVLQPAQWLALDRLADEYGDSGLRLTTRQAVQLHGVLKRNVKAAIAAINEVALSTLAACGDVNRNVMAAPLADSLTLTLAVETCVHALARALAPATGAYHEIWLDGNKLSVPSDSTREAVDEEPLYGPTYLPRKFKCAIAIPPDNDVDVFTQDLGFVVIAEGDRLIGFNVLVGGGMGRAHGDKTTYPRLGSCLGFVPAERLVAVAKAVLTAQRDLGNRGERHHARLKYTIERVGVSALRAEVETRQGFAFEPERPFLFTSTLDPRGWFRRAGEEHLLLHVASGRVRDTGSARLRTALREIAQVHDGDFRLTGNQNLMVSRVSRRTRDAIAAIVDRHALLAPRSGLRLASLSCVAFPTCSLAMAEAERYLPSLLTLLEEKLSQLHLGDEPIVMRMTGCPNGCARPYNAEVGLVGRAPGIYDLYLGGNRAGERLAQLVATNLDEKGILDWLFPLFIRYADTRSPGEGFGDFCLRLGLLGGTGEFLVSTAFAVEDHPRS